MTWCDQCVVSRWKKINSIECFNYHYKTLKSTLFTMLQWPSLLHQLQHVVEERYKSVVLSHWNLELLSQHNLAYLGCTKSLGLSCTFREVQTSANNLLWRVLLRNHLIHLFFFFKILFINEREREKQAPGGEPDVGLDPESPGSGPGLKAVLNHWATRAALIHLMILLDWSVLSLRKSNRILIPQPLALS